MNDKNLTGPGPNSDRRPLTINQKIAILASWESGTPIEEICRQEKICLQTFYNIRDDEVLRELHPKAIEAAKKKLSGTFYRLATRSAHAITDDKLEKSTALQLATIAGIATEKARLTEGLSTENLSVRGVLSEAANDIAELRRKRNKLDASQSE